MAPLCLGAAALASAVCALSLGTPYVPPARLPATLGADGLAGLVVTELRLPRLVLALIAGACLGAAGLVLQEALRNPLAVPEMLGSPPVPPWALPRRWSWPWPFLSDCSRSWRWPGRRSEVC